MNTLQKVKATLASYPILAVFLTWWLIMAVAYLFLSLQVAVQSDRAQKSGIEMTRQLSKTLSLPLLEKNSSQIQSVLAEVGQKPGVVVAWVVDHQNQVVAFTGGEHLLPPLGASATQAGDVDVRHVQTNAMSDYLNLVSAVSYAGTPIGRISVTLSPDAQGDFKDHFMRIAFLSGLLILGLTGAVYRRQLTAFVSQFSCGWRSEEIEASEWENAMVSCPLCGTTQPFSKDVFRPEEFEAIPAVSFPAEPEHRRQAAAGPRVVHLHEAGKREDLAWFKRRVVQRCADIIRTLST